MGPSRERDRTETEDLDPDLRFDSGICKDSYHILAFFPWPSGGHNFGLLTCAWACPLNPRQVCSPKSQWLQEISPVRATLLWYRFPALSSSLSLRASLLHGSGPGTNQIRPLAGMIGAAFSLGYVHGHFSGLSS